MAAVLNLCATVEESGQLAEIGGRVVDEQRRVCHRRNVRQGIQSAGVEEGAPVADGDSDVGQGRKTVGDANRAAVAGFELSIVEAGQTGDVDLAIGPIGGGRKLPGTGKGGQGRSINLAPRLGREVQVAAKRSKSRQVQLAIVGRSETAEADIGGADYVEDSLVHRQNAVVLQAQRSVDPPAAGSDCQVASRNAQVLFTNQTPNTRHRLVDCHCHHRWLVFYGDIVSRSGKVRFTRPVCGRSPVTAGVGLPRHVRGSGRAAEHFHKDYYSNGQYAHAELHHLVAP